MSPEIAYSNEKKKLYDKFGFNKSINQNMMQRSESNVPTIAFHKTGEKLVDQNSCDIQMFIRRKAKVDDSFYEKRVNTLSKTKGKKPQLMDDVFSHKQNHSGIMKRLMTMRKIRQQQNQDYSPLVSQLRESQNLEFNINGYNSRTANESAADLPDQTNKSASFCLGPNDSINQEFRQDTLGSLADYRHKSSEKLMGNSQASFMSRRQVLQSHKKFIPQAKTSSIQSGKAIQLRQSVNNEYSSDVRIVSNGSGMLIVNNEGYEEQNDSSLRSENRSLISQHNNTQRGENKKIQITNRAVNQMNCQEQVPVIKGVTKQQLIDLFQAKCKDLRINPSKDQMTRFFEIFSKNQAQKERKLNLVDMGLGNYSMQVVGQIIRNNSQFSSLDLRNNFISNEGIATFTKFLLQNNTLVHLDVGCNQIFIEGAISLFNGLKNHQSLVSLSIANTDCYKNKNKQLISQEVIVYRIGLKGAIALSELLEANPLIQFLNVADSSISQEGLHYLICGIKENPNMVSVNLSQNDIGSGTHSFNYLLSLFQPSVRDPEKVTCTSLEELILTSNSLTNKHLEDLSAFFKSCARTRLQRLDISHNKLTAKALLSLFHALRHNQHLKLSHLYADKTSLEMGSSQDQVNNFNILLRNLTDYLRTNKSLQVLSLNQCQIGRDLMNAIGRGLQSNEKLEVLSLKGNQIYEDGINELIEAFNLNQGLKIKSIDLSSNKLNDQAGVKLANAFKKVDTLEQVNMRDNNLGIESGDAFLFLIQQKKNLWKLQLDMNMIKYVTLLDIEKVCKKNKRQARFHKVVPDFKQELSALQCKKDPSLKIDEIDKQIRHQSRLIKEGQRYVIEEGEQVHDIIESGQQDLIQYDQEIKRLNQVLQKFDKDIASLDDLYINKDREWSRKITQEESLLERCKEFREKQVSQIDKERERLGIKARQKNQNEEERKLRAELEKIQKEQDMLKIIADNYEKEINRRKGQADSSTIDLVENSSKEENLRVNLIGFKKINATVESNMKGDMKLKKLSAINEDANDQSSANTSECVIDTSKSKIKSQRKKSKTNGRKSGKSKKQTMQIIPTQ